MSEPKIGGTDWDRENRELSTHIVEANDFGPEVNWGREIELMYRRLKVRAKMDDSLILSVVQNINIYVEPGEPGVRAETRLVVILTGQRISREDLERQQRAMQIAQGGPRR